MSETPKPGPGEGGVGAPPDTHPWAPPQAAPGAAPASATPVPAPFANPGQPGYPLPPPPAYQHANPGQQQAYPPPQHPPGTAASTQGYPQQPGYQQQAYGQAAYPQAYAGYSRPTSPFPTSALVLLIVSVIAMLATGIIGIPSAIIAVLAWRLNAQDLSRSRKRTTTGWIVLAVNFAVGVPLLIWFYTWALSRQ